MLYHIIGLYVIFAENEEEIGKLVTESTKGADTTAPVTDVLAKLKRLKQVLKLGNVSPSLGRLSYNVTVKEKRLKKLKCFDSKAAIIFADNKYGKLFHVCIIFLRIFICFKY